jgi:hypothetical protein
MRRLSSAFDQVDWSARVRRLARWLDPVVASPAAPLETFAALDALGPSLMPRTSRLQGISMGLSVLAARATAGAAEPPAHRTDDGPFRAGVPLRTRRTRGARWGQRRPAHRLDTASPVVAPTG